MSAKSIMRRQLLRHSLRKRWLEAATHIDRGEFSLLGCRVGRQFCSLDGEVCPLSIRLRTDRYVFSGRHRKCAGHQAGDTGEQNVFSKSACGRDTDSAASAASPDSTAVTA